MSIFGDLASEMDALQKNAAEQSQQETFLRSLARDPAGTWDLVNIVSKWGDHAPTLPAGAIMGLAHAGIGPDGPMGQTIIRQGVPALSQPPNAIDRATAALGPASPQAPPEQPINPDFAPVGAGNYNDQAPASADLPNLGGGISDALGQSGASLKSIGGTVGGALGTAGSFVNQEAVQPINRAIYSGESAGSQATGNPQSPQQIQEAGIGNTESAKSVAREAFTVGNSGLEALTIPGKVAAAAMNQYVRRNPAGSTYSVPFTGAKFTVGSMSDALSPAQFPLYQQIHGKSLGTGILPGGPASQAAVAAQEKAANVNGHAFTTGRVLASLVAQPDTRPYGVVSGFIDGLVAMNLDPMANALGTVSNSLAAAKDLAPLTDEGASSVARYLIDNARTPDAVAALSDYTRADDQHLLDALATKAKTDPGGVINVAEKLKLGMNPKDAAALDKGLYRAAAGPQAGIFMGLRPVVHKETAIQNLSSSQGDGLITWLRDNSSVSAIRSRLGDQFPVDLIPQLKNATTSDQVRSILSNEFASGGTQIDTGIHWIRPAEDMRMFSQMPKEYIDYTNNQQMVQQAERYLAITKHPRDQWDSVLEPIMAARNIGEARNAVEHGLGDALEQHMIDSGVPARLAHEQVQFHHGESEQQRMFLTDDLGNPQRASAGVVGGEGVPITGPFSWNELTRGAAPLDPRALRQINQKYRQTLHFWNDGYLSDAATIPDVRRQIERAAAKGEPLSTREIAVAYAKATGTKVSRVAHEMVSAESYLTQQLTSYFKGMNLSQVRVPIRFMFDEQMAMTASGIDSMLSGHPFSYFAFATGAKGAHDIEGIPWSEYLGDQQSTFMRALGSASKDSPSPWTTEQQMLKQFVTYGKQDPSYVRGWIDNVSQLHLSPPDREVARAILDPNHVPAGMEASGLHGLDAVKEWFANGNGNKYLQDIQGADLDWGSRYLNARTVSDNYIDELRDRVMRTTAGDRTILDAAANGTPFTYEKMNQGVTKSVDHDFRMYLAEHKDDLGPTVAKARAGAVAQHGKLFDWMTDKFLGALMDVPARVLTRSPAFKQYYYKQVQRLLDFMTPEAQAIALKNAAEDGMDLAKPVANGALEIHDANVIAQSNALAKMKTYLYYPGEKTTAEDILRNVMPFAPAWRSVIKRWSTLAVEHPQIVRYGQMGVQSLQQSGFFRPEPGLGKGDYFTIAGPGLVKDLTGAVGFPMEGSVAGLNMFTGTFAQTHGLPGVGPVVQYPASMLQSQQPIAKAVHDFISPYGDPDLSGGFFESLFPGYLTKLRAGGWLGPIGPTPQQQIVRNDLVKQVFTTAVASGHYDLSDPNVLEKLFNQSKAQADRLYLLRAAGQFALPTAPQYSPEVTLKDGRAITLYKLSQQYHSLLDKFKGDSTQATNAFIHQYGSALIYASRPANLNLVTGGPHDEAAVLQWQQSHADFANKYPSLFGYWVPAGGKNGTGGSAQTYFDLIKSGAIQSLSVEKWAKSADQWLGAVIYSELRSKLPPSLSTAQRAGLDNAVIEIQKIHPFYRQDIGLPTRPTAQQQIVALYGLPGKAGALEDPAVRNTPLGRTAMGYLRVRDQFLMAAGKDRVTGTFNAKSMAGYRKILFQIGTELAAKNPSFVPMWNSLLQREVQPNGY